MIRPEFLTINTKLKPLDNFKRLWNRRVF